MNNQENINIRKVTFNQKIKQFILKIKYGKRLIINGNLRIFGQIPVFKIPPKGRIILGNKVVLNSDFKRSNTALTYPCKFACGLQGVIEIGENSMLNGVSITAYEKVVIGQNCQIASNTFISDTDFHPTDPVLRVREALGHKFDFANVNKKSVIIGNNVWIGWGVIILKGVTIGDNCIVAAGSVILSDVPPNSLIAGNPATVKKMYSNS